MIDYFFSGKQYIRVRRGVTGAGTIDPDYPAPISNWGWGSFGANGIRAALYSGGGLAAAPSTGLGSNSNYFLTNCSNITGLSVLINVDVDMKSDIGFGFQLNAYSAANYTTGAQQYVIMVDSGGVLWGWVNNWTALDTVAVLNYMDIIANLPSATLPAGYALQITLANDSSDRITAATFQAYNASGSSIGSLTLTLKDLPQPNGLSVADGDLAPITAFQLDIVGPENSETAHLSSGLGTIVYTANENMMVEASEPSCVDWDFHTAEQANIVYGTLPAASGNQFAQYFESTTAAIAARIQRAKVLHSLKRPR